MGSGDSEQAGESMRWWLSLERVSLELTVREGSQLLVMTKVVATGTIRFVFKTSLWLLLLRMDLKGVEKGTGGWDRESVAAISQWEVMVALTG